MFVNHHGGLLFPLPNPTKTNCFDPSNWVYDDDIDMEMDEDEPQAQESNIGGGEGGVGSSRAQVIPPEEEGYDPLLTRSHTEMASSGFNEAHFYQYMDYHFSRLNLRLNATEKS